MTAYTSGVEHLLDELSRIDRKVRAYVVSWRKEHQPARGDLPGLVISEEEIDILLAIPPFWTGQAAAGEPGDGDDELRSSIQGRKDAALREGRDLRLPSLQELFSLDSFETDALLTCLLPELDLRYEKIYAYLQNDVTRKRPTVDLVLTLLCPGMAGRFAARGHFSPAAPLVENRLLSLSSGGPETPAPLLSQSLALDERIIGYLLGSDEPDPRIRSYSRVVTPGTGLGDLVMDAGERTAFREVLRHHTATGRPVFFALHGPYGTGRMALAEAACSEIGIPLLAVDARGLKQGDLRENLRLVLREALLQGSSVYLEGCDALLERDSGIDGRTLALELDRFPGWIFVAGEKPWEPAAWIRDHAFIGRGFTLPDFPERRDSWAGQLRDLPVTGVDPALLAGAFQFSPGQIRDAIASARHLATARDPRSPAITMDDLVHGCKAQCSRDIAGFARPVRETFSWDDLILPPDTKEQLREASRYILHKGQVYTGWGFGRKFSLGRGLSILFTGPSGTGKTMAAGILAREAGLDLYRIDLSLVVSKYIGETEKNLSAIFRDAESSGAILFFDEADALFGKRSEVKDAHDRYANIEINYLLQRMEEYSGIVILASNFRKNIDEAFLRRMQVSVEFPLPDESHREQIWRGIFPWEAPLDPGIDYRFLAKFRISGGNIKNIALHAAFLAAGNPGSITMAHLVRATKREFQKMGKLCTPEEFGKYFPLLS
jgi:AAA+ superfamily predicted ATPase